MDNEVMKNQHTHTFSLEMRYSLAMGTVVLWSSFPTPVAQ